MIKATFYKDSNNNHIGFCISGHAGYAKAGNDIVCAAVSVLAINTINAIDNLTDNAYKVENGESGLIKFKFTSKIDEKGKLLIDTLIMGLIEIHNEYGDKYLELYFKEV